MARRSGKRSTTPEPSQRVPASPFRWPSRRRADEAEQAASRAAKAGLDRLRARTPKPSLLPPTSVPDGNSAEPGPRPTLAPQPAEPVAAGPSDKPAQRRREPAPAPWDSELDELTERLVDELRRDLGPETS